MKMKYTREMFLKCPLDPLIDKVPGSHLLEDDLRSDEDIGTKQTHKKGKKSRRRIKICKDTALDDNTYWLTDQEVPDSHLLEENLRSNEDVRTKKVHKKVKNSRRRRKICNNIALDGITDWLTDHEQSSDSNQTSARIQDACHEQKLIIMREIYESQPHYVREVIDDLYKLHVQQRKRALICKRHAIKTTGRPGFAAKTYTLNIGFSVNRKKRAGLQYRRRRCVKQRSRKNRPRKYPRRRRPRNAKQGNRQYRKRCLRAQKLFEKGLLASQSLVDEVWEAVKSPTDTLNNNNNNTHNLTKIHRKQIEFYEKIKEDLYRLNAARKKREEDALERRAKEIKKEEFIHKDGFRNRIEAREAIRIEQEMLTKQRREARKEKALQKVAQKEISKSMMQSFLRTCPCTTNRSKGIEVV